MDTYKQQVFWLAKDFFVRRIALLLLMMLFLFSNTAVATNWIYLQRQEGTRYGPCTEYLDTDSVIKEGDKLLYWTIWVIDKGEHRHDIGKIMFKKEAPLTIPLRHRNLERYLYNREDVESNRYLIPMGFYGESADEINRALSYATKKKASEIHQPDHTVTPTPRWYGYVEFKDCNLYWDIHSAAAWPQDTLTTAEIIVKWVWNKEGLEKRRSYLMAKSLHHADYKELSYTLVNYQFSIAEKKMKVVSVADHSANHERMSFFEGEDWKDIEEGSIDETARRIVLNWIQNQEDLSK